MQSIPLVDLAAQYAAIRGEIDDAIQRVVSGSAFIGGEGVQRFEQEFAAYCGAEAAVGVGNGTDALYLVLRALGVGDGDEVVTVSHTFIATCEAISLTRARPIFVDVRDDTMLLDATQLGEAISRRTKAIVAVHLYGQPCDMDAILGVARTHNLAVIEDAAQAHGARWRGRPVGSLATAAIFSFYPSKNLGAYGDGGAVVSTNRELVERVRLIANHGRRHKYVHEAIGLNSRLDALQAAILLVKLRHLDEWNTARRRHADHYRRLLADSGVVLPAVGKHAEPVWHLFVIRTTERDRLQKELKAEGIEAGVHYPLAVHQQPAYKQLEIPAGLLPISERAAATVMSLPMYPELIDDQVARVADVVRSVVDAG